MTRKQHEEALKALKEINNFSVDSETKINKDTVRVEYKWQKIQLKNGMTLVLSGSMEQHNQIHCTTEFLFLCIGLLDQNGIDLKNTPKQLKELKTQIAQILKV